MIKHTSIDACTACTSCVVQCPVTAATAKFRGPKLLGPGLERFRLFADDAEASVDYCSNCKNCDVTCPSNVPVSTLNMFAKNKLSQQQGRSLRDWILSHGELFAKLGSPIAPLTNIGMNNPITRAVLGMVGIADRPLPAYASQSFYRWFRSYNQKKSAKKVVFFPGCYIGYNDPQVGIDLVVLLQGAGYEVIVPELTCCGTPVVSNGYMEAAREKAEHNLNALLPLIRQGFPLITCCTSCGLMLKQEYLELYDLDGAQTVADSHYDAVEFVQELVEGGAWGTQKPKLTGKYLYHAPCHLRAQGIGMPTVELLSAVEGLEVAEADAGCCGIAGSYGFKKEKYDISLKIGDTLFSKIKQTSPDAVVTECGTCRLQIEHVTGARTIHPISLLRSAYC